MIIVSIKFLQIKNDFEKVKTILNLISFQCY